jgi:hypothetical protein
MLHRVALVRTDVSEELRASFIRVTRISELGTTLAATSDRRTLRRNVATSVVPSSPILVTLMEALGSSKTSVLTGATRHNIPEDTILHSHCSENLKSYKKVMSLTEWTDDLWRQKIVLATLHLEIPLLCSQSIK